MRTIFCLLVLIAVNIGVAGAAPTTAPATSPTTAPRDLAPIDLSKDKTLYVVGYAHLDTQWRWAYPLVIREFLANTLHHNFALFDKYPHYVFNFTGSRRYQMMKEYFPAEFKTLREYVRAGRWFPCGSSVDECDNLIPSAESLVRHVLYGNQYFRREFGVASNEFMLPDSFGFSASLPNVLAHCGIRGFSTQKLPWGSAVGIPFRIGVWEGTDGLGVIAALDPLSYNGDVRGDLTRSRAWQDRIESTGKIAGVLADYHYYGIGDKGGAPREPSIGWVEKSVASDGPVRVVSGSAERMFNDITNAQRDRLPRYKGEMLLTQHSAGSITSQAFMKRMNRKNELLADAAERAAVAAMWLSSPGSYPAGKIYDAWMLVLGSQMHDMAAGTALPKCFEYCWNDELLAANQLAAVATDGVGVVATQLDTRAGAGGEAIVVFNPLSIERQDIVVATVPLPAGAQAAQAASVEVVGPDGKIVPSQVVGSDKDGTRILFLAKAPSVGFATYEVRPMPAAAQNPAPDAGLKITDNTIENANLRVTINAAGDIASIFDKRNDREVLSAPARLAFLYENPSQWPAWNMDWSDRQNPPRSYVGGPATIRVVERGPVRATIEVTRESEGSKFVQRISLANTAAGESGDRVEVANVIDWQTQQRSLKATFPLAVANPQASYDTQVGALSRGNNDPKKYEVPLHQWMDLTDPAGQFGVAILSDCKYGSDKPDDNTLRLTLLYTPGVRGGYRDQATQDIGRHEITYAIAPHAGTWQAGRVPAAAARLNQPMMAFRSPAHPGTLGRSFSLLKLNTDQVAVQAIKKAENSDEIIVRLKELNGAPADDVRVAAASAIETAREIDGQEREIGAATVRDGALVTDLKPYHLRAFAIRLAPPTTRAKSVQSQAVALAYDLDAVSSDDNRADGSFDRDGRTFAAEQLPAKIVSEGIEFAIGPTADGQKNALVCRGQTISLPAGAQPGGFDRVYLLAASANGDQAATFRIGDRAMAQTVEDWGGYIGQWDNRQWDREIPETAENIDAEWSGLSGGFVKRDTVAWFSSHRHHPKAGNEFYQYSYLFKYGFDLPPGATSITLPDNEQIRIFAITVAKDSHDNVVAARPLYDTLADRGGESSMAAIRPSGGKFDDVTSVTIRHPLYWSAGQLRYTTDGSAPTAESRVYDGKPIMLWTSTTIRAREFDAAGRGSGETVASFDITDTTPPAVRSISAVAMAPTIRIDFSEPLRKADAENPASYRLDPPAKVESARLSEDGTSVALQLASPLAPPKDGSPLRLTTAGVRDASPAANRAADRPIEIALARPVFSIDSIVCNGNAKEQAVKNLPLKGKDHFSINLFVRTDKLPDNRTIIAGFGTATDDFDGTGRYIAKFADGIHFWSRVRDVGGMRNDLDVGRWQMITATYDGESLRLFKNARQIARRSIELEDDADAVVRIAPIDPWDEQRRFQGEIRGLTIWNTALPPEALSVLLESKPADAPATRPTGQSDARAANINRG